MNHKSIKPHQIERRWYLVDAQNQILGRLASRIALILQGKHQPYFSPQWDMGDYVVITNASKIKTTGNKRDKKYYYHHTGYPGGIKKKSLGELQTTSPQKLVRLAVKRMLPQNKLADQMIKKLFVYRESQHPHAGQKFLPLIKT